MQDQLPIWLGVGGTPHSFARAGLLGLPLMVAIIGGDPRRFRLLVDLYREAGRQAGYKPQHLRVGVHALGYVAKTRDQAIEEFYPRYIEGLTKAARERGWGPITRAHFDAEISQSGALIVGGRMTWWRKFGLRRGARRHLTTDLSDGPRRAAACDAHARNRTARNPGRAVAPDAEHGICVVSGAPPVNYLFGT